MFTSAFLRGLIAHYPPAVDQFLARPTLQHRLCPAHPRLKMRTQERQQRLDFKIPSFAEKTSTVSEISAVFTVQGDL